MNTFECHCLLLMYTFDICLLLFKENIFIGVDILHTMKKLTGKVEACNNEKYCSIEK